jgi:class 3 adenylate cyclase
VSCGFVGPLVRICALGGGLTGPGMSAENRLGRRSRDGRPQPAPDFAGEKPLEDLLRLRLRQSLEVEAVNAAERAAGALPGARQVTVAFADVAGFTRLGETVPAEELHRLASRLVDLAYTLAVVPVRFIKAIGDEVMLVSTDPGPLLHTVLDLEAAARANGLPRLRIGVASGAAVTRGGDWFGRPVNVASRVTSAARPGPYWWQSRRTIWSAALPGSRGDPPKAGGSRGCVMR